MNTEQDARYAAEAFSSCTAQPVFVLRCPWDFVWTYSTLENDATKNAYEDWDVIGRYRGGRRIQ